MQVSSPAIAQPLALRDIIRQLENYGGELAGQAHAAARCISWNLCCIGARSKKSPLSCENCGGERAGQAHAAARSEKYSTLSATILTVI